MMWKHLSLLVTYGFEKDIASCAFITCLTNSYMHATKRVFFFYDEDP